MPTQVLTNSNRSSCTFASGAHQLLRAACTHIASRENALGAGLEIHAGHNEATIIQLRDIGKLAAIGREANEDEDTWNMQFFSGTGLGVFSDDGGQMVVFTLELNNLCVEAYLDLGRGHSFVSR